MTILKTYLTKSMSANDNKIPWTTLRYLVGETIYGGRVTDDYDRRVVKTYLEEYLGDFLFDSFQDFSFFSNESVQYQIPGADTCAEFIESVDGFPLANSPEVFGLHADAEIGYLTNSVKDMLSQLLSLQPRTATSSEGISREEFIAGIAADLQTKLPTIFDISRIYKSLGTPSPTQVVLLQELERWNVLVETMASSLKDLRRALKGEIGMSFNLDELANSLFNGILPSLWRALCPQTEKGLGSWIQHFEKRFQQYSNWIKNGEPAVIWLSGVF